MLHVKSAEYLSAFCIRLEFNDGFTGVVDLCGRLNGPIFRELNEIARFRAFSVVGHTLAWQNGADLAPEYLRGLAERRLAESSHPLEPAAGSVSNRESSPPAQ